MKFPQFRVHMLLLLTAIMGVVFVACAKWPVTETLAPPVSLIVVGDTTSGGWTWTREVITPATSISVK